MTLINIYIYAATEGKEEIKEQFYGELQRTQDRVPKHDVVIIMGDMKAKLGKEKVFSQVIGRHTLHNPYPTAFPYGNGMVLHFYQQQESSTTKTVHKVINKGLKTYV